MAAKCSGRAVRRGLRALHYLLGLRSYVSFRPGRVAFLPAARRRPAEDFRRRVRTILPRSSTEDCCRCYSGIPREEDERDSSFLCATKGALAGSRTYLQSQSLGELHLPKSAPRATSRPGEFQSLPHRTPERSPRLFPSGSYSVFWERKSPRHAFARYRE